MGRTYRCSIDELPDTLGRILADETGELADKAARIIGQTARECAADLQSRASSLFGGTGEYARGMASSVNEYGLETSAVVYNQGRDAPLGHLLENGHQIVVNVGGRGPVKMKALGRRTSPRPHWKPAYEEAASRMKGRLNSEL